MRVHIPPVCPEPFLCDVVRVRWVWRTHPLPEVVRKRFACVNGVHASIVRVTFVSAIKHPFKRQRWEIGCVRIPIVKKSEPRLILCLREVQKFNRCFVNCFRLPSIAVTRFPLIATILRLRKTALKPASQIIRSNREVVRLTQQLRSRLYIRCQVECPTLCNNLVGQDILAREHRRMGRVCRDMRADTLLKKRCLLCERIEVWCCQVTMPVTTHARCP